MKIIQLIKDLFNPKFTLIYAPKPDGVRPAVDIYVVDNPAKCKALLKDGVKVGFITRCYNRDGQVRAFRFDRIKGICRGGSGDTNQCHTSSVTVE